MVQGIQDCDFGLNLCNQDTSYRTKLLHSVGWSQGNLCGIYDRGSGMGMGYFLRTSVSPANYHAISAWYDFFFTCQVDTESVTKQEQ